MKERTESLRINRVRVEAGRATNLDVAQAQTDLSNAEAQLDAVGQSRAETADALALLCGTSASDLPLPFHPLDLAAPEIPAGLPSSLLERRPDVAVAERNMAAKNALIGVAYAAFFPTVSLTGQGGVLSARATDLFHWQNSIWVVRAPASASRFSRAARMFPISRSPARNTTKRWPPTGRACSARSGTWRTRWPT